MIDHSKILKVPMSEKSFIDPRIRPKFLMNLINEYKKRYPTLELLYAFLNTDAKCPIDYIVLFKTKDIEKSINLIVYDIPLLYSDRSLPGYRYCMRENLLSDFFKEATDSFVTLSLARFNEYLNTMINFSVDQSNERYWRKSEYASEVAKGLMDLALRYNKKQ